MTYTNVKSKKDKSHFDFATGVYSWEITHRDGLKDYLGEDGSEIQIMWENDSPTMYHGW